PRIQAFAAHSAALDQDHLEPEQRRSCRNRQTSRTCTDHTKVYVPAGGHDGFSACTEHLCVSIGSSRFTISARWRVPCLDSFHRDACPLYPADPALATKRNEADKPR